MTKRKAAIASLVLAALFAMVGMLFLNVRAESENVSIAEFQSNWTLENATMQLAGSANQQMIVQQNVQQVTTTEGHNQETIAAYNVPLYLGNNGTETPFVQFSLYALRGAQRDCDAAIFTLTDTEDPNNHISVMMGIWGSQESWSLLYAKATGQYFGGYHTIGSNRGIDGPVDQGTIIEGYSGYNNSNDTIGLYYDTETNCIYTDVGWSSYASRGQTVTNQAGKTLTLIRDLTDGETDPSFGSGFTDRIESAYLKITLVKGWYGYTDEFGETSISNIFSAPFRGGSLNPPTHTLSADGARIHLRSINGQAMDSDGTTITNNGVNAYRAQDVSGIRQVSIPALDCYNVLSGMSEDAGYTATLYMKATDADGTERALTGLSDGKWTNQTALEAEAGVYTVGYYSDQACETLVASSSVEIFASPDFSDVTEDVSPDVFEGANSTFEQWKMQVADSALYNGIIVSQTADATVTYTQDIDISDNTKEDVLLEILPLPTTIGAYDYRRIEVKIAEKNNPDNYFVFAYFYQPDAPSNGACQAAGYGNGVEQDMYGFKSIRKLDELDFSAVTQSLAGTSVGQYQSLKFYYDYAENCLYVSPTYSWLTGGNAGKVKIRDFDGDINFPTNASGTMVTQDPWQGFRSGLVTMEISVMNTAPNVTARYGVLTVDGTSMAKRLDAEAVSKGIVGYEYTLPVPEYYDAVAGQYRDFQTASSLIIVTDPDDEEVMVTDGAFVPEKAGVYTVSYGVLENGLTYACTVEIEVLAAADADEITFDFSESEILDGMTVYLGKTLTAKATPSTQLYLGEDKTCALAVEIYKNEDKIAEFTGEQIPTVNCDAIGLYEIHYTATDYVGRTETKVISFSVVRSIVTFTDPSTEQLVFDRTEEVPAFSASDIETQDISIEDGTETIVESEDFYSYDVAISVSYNDGDPTDLSQNSFAETGTYRVIYTVTYTLVSGGESYTASVEKTVTVVDSTPPEFYGENVIGGGYLNESKTENGAVWYKAKVGNEITVGSESARDSRKDGWLELENIQTTFTPEGGQTSDITASVAEGYKFTPDRAGIYYIVYSVSDGELTASKTYAVEAKNVWLEAEITDPALEAEFGEEYTFPAVRSWGYGDAAVEAAVEMQVLSSSGMNVAENGTWIPGEMGTFTVRCTVSYGGETVVREYRVTVKDSKSPVISFAETPEQVGYVGRTYTLPQISVQDNADENPVYKIYLVHNGTRTEIFSASFVPEEEGEYQLVVECTDFSGNTETESVTITVTNEVPATGCSSTVNGIYAWMLIPCVACFVVVNSVKCMKRRNSK